jgi:hypothetical protein
MTYHWKTLFAGLAALAILLWLGEPSHAEEGGSGQYIIGAYASLLNITPNKPGFAASDSFIFYGGSAGKSSTLPFGGLLASNLNANCYLEEISLAYTRCPPKITRPSTETGTSSISRQPYSSFFRSINRH